MNTTNKHAYHGSCHCGAIEFAFDSVIEELTTCDCSICKKKNALMLKVHESDFKLISGESSLVEYQFHTKTARHFFCQTCGIYPFHRKRVTPDYYGINVNCLDDFQINDFKIRETNGSEMS